MPVSCKTSVRNFRAPRRLPFAASGVFALLGLGLTPTRAHAAPPRYADVLPLSQVKPGMKGYGLTTFKGTTISRFEVEVVGILKKENVGHDLILIRMKGGPITERGANLIQGMSGSPIYLNGKVAGAFSMGESFPKEPVGMVTPIEDMLDAWDPSIPQQPGYFQPASKTPSVKPPTSQTGPTSRLLDNRRQAIVLPAPVQVGSRRIARLVLNERAGMTGPWRPDEAHLVRATSLLSVNGISSPTRQWLQKELDNRGYGVTIAQAPIVSGKSSSFKSAPLQPGSAFGTFLSTGDVQVGATGTITYRRGDRVLGFGHPLFGLGAVEAAITSAYIVDIFSGVQVSHHIAVAGPVIGSLVQDRDFSVSGYLNRRPTLIPFDVTVHDATNGRTQTFHSGVFQHPDLTSVLLRLIAREAVTRVHNVPGDVMARVTTSVTADEVGKVTRHNLVYDANEISTAASSDLGDITNIVSGNPFYPLPIRRASMNVEISAGHNTATVERIFLKQGRYEPGDTLDIGVVLKPYRQDAVIRGLSLKIPSDTPTGRYQLIVRGGTPNVIRLGGFILSGGSSDPQTPPVNVRQMVARLNNREANTDLVARMLLNTVAPALEGEKLSQLPPNLSALMRSDRNSGVRLERDELRQSQGTDFVVSGSQQLIVNVVRKNTQEAPQIPTFGGNGGGSSSPSGSPPSLSLGGGTSSGSGSSDDDAAAGPNPALPLDEPFAEAPNALVAPWLARLHGTSEALVPNREAQPVPTREVQEEGYQSKEPDAQDKPDIQPDPGKGGGGKTGDKPKQKPKPAPKKGKNSKGKTSTSAPSSTAATPDVAPPAPAPAAPVTPPETNDKPVGRQLQVWRQAGPNGFAGGKFAGTSLAANGELRLTSRLRRLATTTETYIWSLATDKNGVVYAGTGTSGKILRLYNEGKVTTFATLPVVSVQSLLADSDGTLWAGSGVKGNLYHVRQDGTYTLVATLPEKYILALALDSKHNLYIAPAGGGTVYRLDADKQNPTGGAQAKLTPWLKTTADHVMALAVGQDDTLYAGTGNEGILYKVTSDGKSSVLYDAKENAITALAADSKGNVYAGTGPKGLLYRIAPDGTATVLYDRATSFYTGIRVVGDNSLYASTVNAVYAVQPGQGDAPTTVQPLDNPRDVDILTLAVPQNTGQVIVGTGNIGELYTSALEGTSGTMTGTYESVIHDARLTSRWGMLRWDGSVSGDTQIKIETHTGNVAEPDSTWSAWEPIRARQSGAKEGAIVSPPARFIQYRVTLNKSAYTRNGSNRAVREVNLSYLPRNQAPRVTLQSPQGTDKWAKSQTIRWSGSDPDNDTLTYEVSISSDGLNWQPLPTTKEEASRLKADGTTTPAPTTTATSGTGTTPAAPAPAATQTPAAPMPPVVAEAQSRLDAQGNVPDNIKQQIMERIRKSVADGTLSPGAASTGLRDTSKPLDTKLLPDGIYWLRVIASDSASNPIEPQTAQAVSDPFVICNALPQVTLGASPLIASRRVTLEGAVSQSLIAVSAVQYRVDGGDWMAAASKDGLFDTGQESFTLTTLPLPSGKHTLEVAAFNAAGGKTIQKTDVTVP